MKRVFKSDALDLKGKGDQLLEKDRYKWILSRLLDLFPNSVHLGEIKRIERNSSGKSDQYVIYFQSIHRESRKKSLVPHISISVNGRRVRFFSNVNLSGGATGETGSVPLFLDTQGRPQSVVSSIFNVQNELLLALQSLPWDYPAEA